MEKRCLQQEYGGDTGMSSCFNEVGPCDLLACLMIERLTERGIDPSALDVYTIRDRALFHTDCDVHLEKPEYGEKFRRRHLKRKS